MNLKFKTILYFMLLNTITSNSLKISSANRCSGSKMKTNVWCETKLNFAEIKTLQNNFELRFKNKQISKMKITIRFCERTIVKITTKTHSRKSTPTRSFRKSENLILRSALFSSAICWTASSFFSFFLFRQ